MPLKLTTYYHRSDIPELPGNNTFHSIELFHIYEATPGYTPLLIVASEAGRPLPSYWRQYERVFVCFHPLSSRDVKSMAQESILMKLLTRSLSLVRCCNG